MKLHVPLMMPAIHSMRLAASPSRSALIVGMQPATAASNATITLCLRAAAKISLPCSASSALLAVTTCLPRTIAARIASFATVVPPITSTTMSISGLVDDLRGRRRRPGCPGPTMRARALDVARGDHRDLDLPARPPRDLLAVAFEDVKRSAPDRSDAEQTDFDGFHRASALQRIRCRRPASSAKRRSISAGQVVLVMRDQQQRRAAAGELARPALRAACGSSRRARSRPRRG